MTLGLLLVLVHKTLYVSANLTKVQVHVLQGLNNHMVRVRVKHVPYGLNSHMVRTYKACSLGVKQSHGTRLAVQFCYQSCFS